MIKNSSKAEMDLRIYNLEWFAARSYPDRKDLQVKSVFHGLLKMNPDWARRYLVEKGQVDLLKELESQETEFLAFEAWYLELLEYWRNERDPDGKIDAYIRSKCPEDRKREFVEVKKG